MRRWRHLPLRRPAPGGLAAAREPPRCDIVAVRTGTMSHGRVARGNLTPGLPQNPCVTVSRYTALVVLVLWRAGFTQAQCAKYRGRFRGRFGQARMAFLQDR